MAFENPRVLQAAMNLSYLKIVGSYFACLDLASGGVLAGGKMIDLVSVATAYVEKVKENALFPSQAAVFNRDNLDHTSGTSSNINPDINTLSSFTGGVQLASSWVRISSFSKIPVCERDTDCCFIGRYRWTGMAPTRTPLVSLIQYHLITATWLFPWDSCHFLSI